MSSFFSLLINHVCNVSLYSSSQALVVRGMDNAILWINRYLLNRVIPPGNSYPPDSDLSVDSVIIL